MPTPADDYRALREGAAAFELEGWRALRLTGADTREFLQGTASQDVTLAGPDRAVETLFLSEKGRPVAHAWVAIDATGAEAWVIADRGSIDALRPHLERFRIMEDVEFDAPDGAPRVAGVAGPGRDTLLAALASRTPGSRGITADPLSFLLLPAGAAALPDSAAPEAVEAWRLSRGIPLGGVDFDLDRIATELDLLAAVSFTKGCYVGQEVVARTSNRGQVRRRRVGFRFSWTGAAPGPSTPLLSQGAAVGFLTSAAIEPGTREWLGMGYLATERIDDGSPVGLPDAAGDEAVPIQLGDWPL